MRKWSEEDKQYLRDNYAIKSSVEISKVLGRTANQINGYAHVRLGLQKTEGRRRAVKAEWLHRQLLNPIKPRKYSLNERYFESIDTPEKAYWYGFLWADGNVQTRNKAGKSYQRVRLYLHEKDKYAVEAFVKSIEGTMPVKPQNGYGTKNHNYGCEINSWKMAEDLIKLNVVPNKSHKQEIPVIADDLFRHFFLGLFDGDGHVFVKGNQHTIAICCTSAVGDWLINMIDKHVGVNSNHYKASGEYARNWSVNGFFQVKDMVQWMYEESDFCLQRKKEYCEKYDLLLPEKAIE